MSEELPLLSFSQILDSCKSEVELLGKVRKGEAEAREGIRENIEKLLVSLPTSISMQDEDVSSEQKAELFALIFTILSPPVVEDPFHVDFFMIPHAVTLFLFATSEFEEESKEHIPVLVSITTQLLITLADLPDFGKKTDGDNHVHGADCDHSDSDEDEGEGALGKIKLTPAEYQLFTFNQCSRLFLSLLAEPDNSVFFAESGSAILGALKKAIFKAEFPQLKFDIAELFAQIGLLCLKPQQVKIWEELESHEEIMENLLEEEEEGGEILDAMAEFDYYDKYPYFSCTLPLSDLSNLAKFLTELAGTSGIEESQSISESGVSLSSVVSIICAIAANSGDTQAADKLTKDCVDIVIEQLRKSNQSETCLDKIPLITCLGDMFALSSDSLFVGHFSEFLNLFDSINQKEHQKIQPKPAAGRGRGRGRGGRGRGRGGRGGGGGGGGAVTIDPEKEMEFKLLQRVLARSLGKLLSKGGLHLITHANKFFTSLGNSFKWRDLMFEYLVPLKSVLINNEEAKKHENYVAVNTLCSQKAAGQYQFITDSIKAKFGTRPKKLEGIRCMTKLVSATTHYKSGVPLFPEYLGSTLDIFIESLASEPVALGSAIFSGLETLIKTYPETPEVKDRVPAILKSCTTVLGLKPAENKEEEDEAVYSSLYLSAFDISKLVHKYPQFHSQCPPFASTLCSLSRNAIKGAIEKVKEVVALLASLAEATKEKEIKHTSEVVEIVDVTDQDNPTVTPVSTTIPKTEPVAFPKFDFSAGSGAGTNIGGTTLGGAQFNFPSFNFGAPPATTTDASQVAFPTFNWTAVANSTTNIDSDSDDFSDFSAVKRGGGGRGGRGGRGRGRGRGVVINDSDEDEDEDDDDDGDDSYESGDSFDFGDASDSEGELMEEQASICVAAIETLVAVTKILPVEEREPFREAVAEGISACEELEKVSDLGGLISKLRVSLQTL